MKFAQTADFRHISHGLRDFFAKKQTAGTRLPSYGLFGCHPYALAKLKGLAVSALLFGRIHLMCAHLNALQCTIIRSGAMVCALFNGAANALVCMTFIHDHVLLIGLVQS